MHEVSIMEQTLALAFAQTQAQEATQILRLKMKIGAMSGVVPEALEFAFSAVTEGTLAEGATLDIETIAVTCRCQQCDRIFAPPDYIYECPHCGTFTNQTLTGKEIELTSLEVI